MLRRESCPLHALLVCAKYQAHSLFSVQGILMSYSMQLRFRNARRFLSGKRNPLSLFVCLLTSVTCISFTSLYSLSVIFGLMVFNLLGLGV